MYRFPLTKKPAAVAFWHRAQGQANIPCEQIEHTKYIKSASIYFKVAKMSRSQMPLCAHQFEPASALYEVVNNCLNQQICVPTCTFYSLRS